MRASQTVGNIWFWPPPPKKKKKMYFEGSKILKRLDDATQSVHLWGITESVY